MNVRSRPVRAWLALAAVLLAMLIGGALFVQQQGRKLHAETLASAQRQLDLLASLVRTHLERGHYDGAAQSILEWGQQAPQVVSLSLLADNGFSLAEYRRSAGSRHTQTLRTDIPYAYRDQATLALVMDLEPVQRDRQALALQIGVAYLILALLLIGLTRLLLLYRREALMLRARSAELSETLGQRDAAETERDRLISVLDATTDVVGILEPDGLILYVNRAGRRLTGIGDQPATSLRIAQLHPPWAYDLIMHEGIPAAIRAGAWSGETALLGPDGGQIPVSQVILSHRDGQGQLAYLSTVMRDISELKRVEMQLRASEAQLAEAQAIAHFGSWDLDLATGKANWSREEYRLLGYAPGEVEASMEAFLARVHADDRQWVQAQMQAAMTREDGRYRVEHRIALPDGSERIVLEQGRVTFDEDHRPLRMVGTTLDVTELRRTERELEAHRHRLEELVEARTRQVREQAAILEQRSRELAAANRELEAFAYSVSHDLRAPLRAIDGFSQALQEDYGERLDGTGQDYLHRVRAAAQRMAALIDDLLKLSRVTRSPLQPTRVDISRLAEEAVAALREQQPERRVEVTIQPGMTAWGDPGLVRTALDNLIGNAWKYTSRTAEARIAVGCERTGADTVFYVRDNGAGFDMRHADRLFTPFQRLHHPTEFEGSGIGLATVQRIVHRHGGRIWAEARPGEGATFLFTLGGVHALPNAPLSDENHGDPHDQGRANEHGGQDHPAGGGQPG